MKYIKTFFILIILAVILSLGIYGAREYFNKQVSINKEQTTIKVFSDEEPFQKGITLTPQGFSFEEFPRFLNRTDEIGKIITWTGAYSDLLIDGSGPDVLMKLKETKDIKPILIFSCFSSGTEFTTLPPLSTQETEIHDALMAFVTEYKPQYIGLGNEINILYEKSPEDFERYVTLFNSYYDEIKQVSPETNIFVVFQLERIKGLKGGLFGGADDITQNDFTVMDRFVKADFFAFTSYPGLIYKTPQEIPTTYYSDIATTTDKSIIFSEIGWSSGETPAGWESNETEQANFIDIFWQLNQDLQPKFVIWNFMYDQEVTEPFNQMGLVSRSDTEKIGWERFLSK